MTLAARGVSPEALHEQAYFDDPWPVWERLRHEQPLFHDTVADRWLLTRHDDVASVFADHETYSTKPYKRIFSDVIGPTMVEMDGPDHDIRRAIVAPEMVGRKLQTNYLGLIDAVVDELIAALPEGPRVDLIGSFSGPLPLKVVATVLGMEPGDDAYLKSTTDRIIAALAGEEPALSEGIAAHRALAAHIDALIEERMTMPGRDLISGIAHGRTEAGERLSRAEIASFISLLLVAGGETTDRGLANFWYVLLRHPDVFERISADPSLIDAAFSEFMRRDGVVDLRGPRGRTGGRVARSGRASWARSSASRWRPRTTTRPCSRSRVASTSSGRTSISARSIAPGSAPTGSRATSASGSGKHFCIGYQLARAEILAGTRGLLEHLRRPRLARDPQPHMAIRWMHRYVDRLVIEHG